MPKRIVFTGGTGKAGRHAVPHLLAKGHAILNVDLKPLPLPGVNTLIADLTDSGQAFNALTTHFGFDGFERGQPPGAPDAVVHFAAIPRVLIEPDNRTFAANVVSTYNVIEAAMKLGVRKVIVASSETTYGVCFAEGDKDFHSFPLDESYDGSDGQLRPLQGRQREDRARLRDALRRRHLRPAHRQRDRAARIRIVPGLPRQSRDTQAQRLELHRCARPRRDRRSLPGEGRPRLSGLQRRKRHDHARRPTREILARYCPKTPITRELGEFEAPISTGRRAKY